LRGANAETLNASNETPLMVFDFFVSRIKTCSVFCS
jgi:hypothetical protein